MRKLYLFLAAAAMTISASAAIPFGHQVVKGSNALAQFKAVDKASTALYNAEAKTGIQKAPAKATEIITEVQGETKYFNRAGGAFYVSSGYLYEDVQEGVMEVVFAEDGTVYFKDLVSYFGAGSYVKGTLEGNTITVPMGQTLYTWADYGYGAEIRWGNVTRDEDGEVMSGSDVVIDEEATEAVFTYDAEAGTITLEGSNENHILAAFYDDDQTWTGRGDYNSVYTFTEIPEPVVPPVPTTESYFHIGQFSDGDVVNQTVTIMTIGDQVYIQGLTKADEDYSVLPDAWVKGTIENNVVTIENGQFLGMYNGNFMYLFGCNEDSEPMDITFVYDPETDVYTLQNYYAVNGKADQLYYYYYFDPGNVLSKEELYIPEVVEVPENLKLYPYVLKTNELTFDSETGEPIYTPVTLQLTLGVDENYNMYLQGLCQDLPEAWVTCHYDDDYNMVIPGCQNFGIEEWSFLGYVFEYPHFLLGMDADGNLGTDIVLYYDADADVYFSNTDYIIDNEKPNVLSYYHIYTDPQMNLIEEKAAKPATPEITAYTPYESYGYARINCNIPTVDVDGNDMVTSKLFYRVYLDIETVVEQLTFDPSEYIYFETSMTEIPYNFSDSYDVYAGGTTVYLNQPNALLANKVGLQTVYYGGLDDIEYGPRREVADNESEIFWFDIKEYTDPSAVSDVNSSKTVKSVRYYNVAGIESNKPFDGMNIVVKTYTDGTTSTAKVIK